SATPVRVEQTGATFSEGTWGTNTNIVHSGGSAIQSMDKGARATFTFNGTGVSWVGFRDPWSGIANVYLDGALTGVVDTYSATQQAQVVNYSVSDLASGSHTLVIEVAGTRNPSSKGLWVWVDAFDVRSAATTTGSTAPTPPASDTNASIIASTPTTVRV